MWGFTCPAVGVAPAATEGDPAGTVATNDLDELSTRPGFSCAFTEAHPGWPGSEAAGLGPRARGPVPPEISPAPTPAILHTGLDSHDREP
jgi:hypothetical protein